ncbi:MAG: D-glucuronyl C5-epimerase family protein [Actinomycetes bacterium]
MFRAPVSAAAAVLILLATASSAAAGEPRPQLLRVSIDGHAVAVSDRLPGDLPLTRPSPPRPRAKAAAISGTVTRTIDRMVAQKRISRSRGAAALASWRQAVEARKRTKGAAGAALGAAIDSIVGIAARGDLTPSRLEAAILTAKRNSQFFASGRTPAPYTRVQFNSESSGATGNGAKRSDLVWQYYPGQGLQLQVLASFGVANGLWRASRTKPALKRNLRALLDELSSLAAGRAGGVAWEYQFAFGGGKPPWASGMTQATAVQALSRGAAMLDEPKYAALARRALPLFDSPPPSGVRLATARGPWYLMYTFDRSQLVLNGFLQSLIGLDEMRDLTKDKTADRLFRSADPVARAALPRYRSSGWSYYSPGEWDTVEYHSLTTGFLEELCRRTGSPAYCSTGKLFRGFLESAPSVAVKTGRLRTGRTGKLRIWVSKPAKLTVTVRSGTKGGKVLATTADLSPGIHSWNLRPPRGTKLMTVSVKATDSNGRSRSVKSTVVGVGK